MIYHLRYGIASMIAEAFMTLNPLSHDVHFWDVEPEWNEDFGIWHSREWSRNLARIILDSEEFNDEASRHPIKVKITIEKIK